MFEDFLSFIKEAAKTIESIQHRSAEEIADFCIEEDISPSEIMYLANQGVKYLREEEECDNPRELFPGVFEYLENNGFVYDEDEGRFRETYSGADSQ